MQMPWLGKGGNAVPQPKMQTLQNKIWTIRFVYAVLYIVNNYPVTKNKPIYHVKD